MGEAAFLKKLARGGLALLLPYARQAGAGNEAGRIAWLEKTLKSLPAGSQILDAGAGERQFKKFCSHLKYVSQDFAHYDGQGNGRGLQRGAWNQEDLDIVSDITAIPRPDASFDAIMCTEVLEHLPDPIGAAREFGRLLRMGGRLILTAPFCSLTHFAPFHFYTGFNRYFYETHLPAYGFAIEELSPNGDYFQYLAQEIKRVPSAADAYGGGKASYIESLALKVVANMLGRMSETGSGSSDILSYGLHVLAVKK